MIISSISYKGGVGKTTISQNLAVSLAHKGFRVCLIDADGTQASVQWAGVRAESEGNKHIQVVSLTEPKSFIPNVRELYKDYDMIIIDSAPSLSPVASKIMLVSHLLLIPVTPSGGSDIWVTETFLERYVEIQQQKESFTPAYFVINKFKPKVNLHQAYDAALEQFDEEFQVKKLNTRLHDRVAFGEANAMGVGTVEYTNKLAKKEIEALTKEIISIGEKI